MSTPDDRVDEILVRCPHPGCYSHTQTWITTNPYFNPAVTKIEFKEHVPLEKRAAHNFSRDFQQAVFKALGLEGRMIRRLILTMEVDRPITLQIDSYATFPDGQPYLLANLLKLASFEQTPPTPEKETD